MPTRVTYSPLEFAALFGKSQTWGYRQIYAGRVQTTTEFGRMMIPAKEVERILASSPEYSQKPVNKADTAVQDELLVAFR